MKLYATVTSERASKSQGGKSLSIMVQGEKKEYLLSLLIEMRGDRPTMTMFNAEAGLLEDLERMIKNKWATDLRDKANKQKGECASNHWPREIRNGKEFCTNCGQAQKD